MQAGLIAFSQARHVGFHANQPALAQHQGTVEYFFGRIEVMGGHEGDAPRCPQLPEAGDQRHGRRIVQTGKRLIENRRVGCDPDSFEGFAV